MKPLIKHLGDPQQIEAAFAFLKERFMSAPTRPVPVIIQFDPNDLTVEVRWFPSHQFWVAFDPGERIMLGLTEISPEPGEKVCVTLDDPEKRLFSAERCDSKEPNEWIHIGRPRPLEDLAKRCLRTFGR
jgi:hypothetical protein